MNPLIQSKNTTILPVLIALTLGCFGLSPQARAVCREGCDAHFNTALGEDALLNNTDGQSNTAIGFDALYSNIGTVENDGSYNTAIGDSALYSNTFGVENTAIGFNALFSNNGFDNTAIGVGAMQLNTTGGGNTANGHSALESNTTGGGNTATGHSALLDNTTGRDNTAIGSNALVSNTTGSNNIALGASAGFNLTAGDNNIYIGNAGVADESNTIRIGTQGTQTRTFIAGISGSVLGGGSVPVRVTTSGRLGTAASSERFKQNIKPMDKASEAILTLKPVSFRYKEEIDPDATPQFGLVAEDVEKVNPDLVVRDEDGRPYTVRYEAVNAMLLNEFIKEHRKVQELEANAARQQKQIEALTAGLQKVSAQLELSKPVQQTVLNNQ